MRGKRDESMVICVEGHIEGEGKLSVRKEWKCTIFKQARHIRNKCPNIILQSPTIDQQLSIQ